MKRMTPSTLSRMVAYLVLLIHSNGVWANPDTGTSNQLASVSVSVGAAIPTPVPAVSNQVNSVSAPATNVPPPLVEIPQIAPPRTDAPPIDPVNIETVKTEPVNIEPPRMEIPRSLSAADEDRSTHSLRALELRALKAQALEELVVAMQQRLDAMAAKVRESELKVELLENRMKLQEAQRLKLVKDLEESSYEIKQRDQLLKLFRSGDFEYYQVQAGDTVTSIAANPMVYGNAERAPWIAQVNSLTPETPLVPGAILVIPRYTEGVSYEF